MLRLECEQDGTQGRITLKKAIGIGQKLSDGTNVLGSHSNRSRRVTREQCKTLVGERPKLELFRGNKTEESRKLGLPKQWPGTKSSLLTISTRLFRQAHNTANL